MDMVARGSHWLRKIQQAYLTQPIVIRRGVDENPLLATVSDTVVTSVAFNGETVSQAVRDFMIQVDTYPYAKPSEDDVFIMDDGREYEVCRAAGDEFFRYADSSNLAYLIHTTIEVDI